MRRQQQDSARRLRGLRLPLQVHRDLQSGLGKKVLRLGLGLADRCCGRVNRDEQVSKYRPGITQTGLRPDRLTNLTSDFLLLCQACT